MSVSPPEQRIWWNEPIHKVELGWIVIVFLWGLFMFFFMIAWHFIGDQNLSTETYRIQPSAYEEKVEVFAAQYQVGEEEGVLVRYRVFAVVLLEIFENFRGPGMGACLEGQPFGKFFQCRVRKAEGDGGKRLAERLFAVDDLQVILLHGNRRLQQEFPIAHEDRAGDFVDHRRQQNQLAGFQRERPDVFFKDQIGDVGDSGLPDRHIPKL